MPSAPSQLLRQIVAFTGVGVIAAIVHYGLLIGLVEIGGWRAVPATLVGYVGGGIVSYGLNRRHTYQSDRPHEEAGWRFALVAAVGFGLTYGAMHLLVETAAGALSAGADRDDAGGARLELPRPQILELRTALIRFT